MKSDCHRIEDSTALYHNKRRIQAIRLDDVKESFENIPDFEALPLSFDLFLPFYRLLLGLYLHKFAVAFQTDEQELKFTFRKDF